MGASARFFSNLSYTIRHGIPYGISQLLYYSPTIWNDADFDCEGLLRLMRLKLQQLEPALRHGHTVKGCERADEIRTVIDALDCLIAHNYVFEEEEPINQKWGKSKMGSKPTDNPLLRELTFTRPNVLTPQHQEIVSAAERAMFKRAHEREKVDRRTVFNTIRDKYVGWWD